MTRRRTVAALLTLAASAGLSACGGHTIKHNVEDEGEYFDVGGLQYQVQISRQLNVRNIEDKDYLIGLNRFDAGLPANQVYFAVFLQVDNSSNKAEPAAKKFVLEDTQDNKFTPIPLAQDNVYAYRPVVVPAKGGLQDGLIPAPNSSAIEGPTQGALVLFKVPQSSLANRPLELHVTSPDGNPKHDGSVQLDV